MENKDNITTEQYPLVSQNPDINFIYKKLKMCNYTSTTYWINNNEFATKIRELKNQNITITDRMIYDIMRDIYFQKQKEKIPGIKSDFRFQLAKPCIKSLHYSFTGSKTGWETR